MAEQARKKKKKRAPGPGKGKFGKAEPVRLAVARAYMEFDRGGAFKENPPGHIHSEADRRLYVGLLRGMVRHKRLLETELERLTGRPTNGQERAPAAAALLGLFQLRSMERIPPHAAVFESVALAGVLGHPRAKGWINAVLRRAQRELAKGEEHGGALPLAARTSYPDAMTGRWCSRYGDEAAAGICEAGNQAGSHSLRVETGRITAEELIERLREADIKASPHPLLRGALLTEQTGALLHSSEFAQGLCYLQDVSSQLLLAWTAPLFTGLILDLCAAPGGKLTLLAGWRREGLRPMGVDISGPRLELIRENLKRLRLPSPPLIRADGRALPFRSGGCFQGVVLDAPCSATGTIGKHPDLKWRWREADLPRYAQLQRELMNQAARVIKPGGFLLYVTCSLEPEENEENVAAFLAERKDFTRRSFRGLASPKGLGEPPVRFITKEGDFLALPATGRLGLFGALLVKH